MFHLKNRSITALNIASDSSKYQNIGQLFYGCCLEFSPPTSVFSASAAEAWRRLLQPGCMVSPLVWSNFFGQNVDLTSGLHCTNRQIGPTACGTFMKHSTKLFSQLATPDGIWMSNLIGPFVILILAASSYFLAPLAGQRGQNTAWRERISECVTTKFCPHEKT